MNARRRLLLLFFVSLCIALIFGCGEESAPASSAASDLRLIADDPAEILRPSDLLVDQIVLEERFTEESWTATPPARLTRRGDDLLAVSTESPIRFDRSIEWSTKDVQAVDLTVANFRRGRLRLLWLRRGETVYDETRFVQKSATVAARSGAAQQYRFDTATHPDWHGEIVGLRIAAYVFAGDEPAFQELRAVRRDIDRKTLAEVAPRAYKVALGDASMEVFRNARLALPEAPLEWTTSPGILRFAYGVDPLRRTPTVFRIVSNEEVLFEDRVDSSGWRTASVDVDRPGALRFETESEDDARGFAFWGHPELRQSEDDAPWSVLLISIDTLRADRLSSYGYERETTPRLDAWAEEATLFQNTVAAAPWTLPSHVSMLTGLDAIRHGVNHDLGQSAPAELAFLAEILRDQGYATAASTGGVYLHPRYGFAQGFDHYRSWSDARHRWDELREGVDDALAFLEERREEPAFFFLHTYAVHDPFDVHPEQYRRLVGADPPPEAQGARIALHGRETVAEEGFYDRKELMLRLPRKPQTPLGEDRLAWAHDFYDAGVAEMDVELGRLFDELRERGLDRRLLVALTSDHGEALGENGRVGHVGLGDEVLLVPWILRAPDGLGSGLKIDEQVRSIDLVPTLLDLLDIEIDGVIDGVSATPLLRGEPVEISPAWSYAAAGNRGLAMRSENRLKYLYNNTAWPPLQGSEALYDLRRDPGEAEDLLPREIAQALQERARAVLDEGQGLVLMIEAKEEPLSVEIFGSAVRPDTVKAAELPDGCVVRWIERGRLAVEAAVGARFELRFEQPTGSSLRLVFASGEEVVLDAEENASVDGFSLIRRGASSAAAPMSAELEEQLRALGYL